MIRYKVLTLLSILSLAAAQDYGALTPPYFNIAENRKVSVNATCGVGVPSKEVYCKLVGYDKFDIGLSKYDILDGQICDYCYPPSADASSEKTHPGSNVVDGDTRTWWQSPPISRGLKYNRVTLEIDLQQLFQVAYVVVTMANSPRPGVWALERSIDHGETWQPWQYFAGNDAECQKYFGIHADEPIIADDQVVCVTDFSKVLPIEDGEVFVSLTKDRPSSSSLFSNNVLQNWITATNIRLRLIQTKTMLGHLMSVAQGDKTVTRRYYYSIKEISVGGRCVCNGHAFVCPPSKDDPDILQCQCQHNTAGINCDQCADGFTQKKWRQYTDSDKFECEPCNCHGHSDSCYYDEDVDAQGLSLDIHGNYEGGGVCQNCKDFTTGINCHLCVEGYFRPEGVLPNDTQPCIPCQCDNDHRYTGNCAPESGQCECKEAFRGAEDCTDCADGYYGYPECKPCDCFANGTELQASGLPYCVAEGVLQCPCLPNFSGVFCNECAEGYYNFPDCIPCDCNGVGALNQECDRETGQCQCGSNYGSRQCEECRHGFYNYPDCISCNCDAQGTVEEICDKEQGTCICKEGYAGERCDRCQEGWFDYPNCKPCDCSEVGSDSRVCDPEGGQCPCYSNYGGRQCLQCSPGFFGYPDCNSCNCDSIGSLGVTCDDQGVCTCHPDFVGIKCDSCAPKRYNYPRCEECNCNPQGVTKDFFALGGCENVPPGTLCTCKEKVTGRICDTCKPLYWNLQGYNPQGCEDCACHRPGTIGTLAVCDTVDGQCACKPNVGGQPRGRDGSSSSSRICDTCTDGFYDLQSDNPFGCKHCKCDVGGTQLQRGEFPVCDKDSGQCNCRPGMLGRRCDDILSTHYVPTLHQYQYEIEDGYRSDGSPVRIGYDDARFPGYSWRGYGSYSQLQNEVLLPVSITNPSVYRMVLHYSNPNPTPIVGEIVVTPLAPPLAGGELGPDAVPASTRRDPLSHKFLLSPTGGEPNFMTVSGDKGVYPSPFDLDPGQYTVAVRIPNNDPAAQDILVDYFAFVPNEYYEPAILKEDIFEPCLAGEQLPYCRQYTYPELTGIFPTSVSESARRPDGGSDIYNWEDRPEVLMELRSRELASLARWQPDLEYPMAVNAPGMHVLAILFYTPDEINGTKSIDITAKDEDEEDRDAQSGQAYIFNCKTSELCRQVVTDPEGRVQEFMFNSTIASIRLQNYDPDLHVGIDSVVAVPLEKWSLDYIKPTAECIKKDGYCIPFTFSDPPDQSVIVPFVGPTAGPASANLPVNIEGSDPQLLYVDSNNPLVDVTGAVPKPGYYVLVANYYQSGPGFEMPLNITFANQGEALDVEDFLAKGQYHEAVLPLPTCASNSGCRSSIINSADGTKDFNLPELFHISSKLPSGKPLWLESVVAIPTENYRHDFLLPEKIDKSVDFAKECGQNHFHIDTNDMGFCRSAVISISSEFNGGALDCHCDMRGSEFEECEKVGGQCPCKPNVIGRQCTRCKPGFFGYPNCKECNCPPTARCNEETGDCICAPHVTGPPDNPCSRCEENTFGYDPITGCQECMCATEGTVNANMSCSLENGNCFCKENIEGRTCNHCSAGYFRYPDCEQCQCDLRGTTQDICDQETAECLCKPNVEGAACDTCQVGKFNLQERNPDGCTDCFCFGKTTYCKSHDRLMKSTIEDMENWELTSFKIDKILESQDMTSSNPLTNYNGEIVAYFTDYPMIDLSETSIYFSAPSSYLRSQIFSYGGELIYTLTYSGYEFEGAPTHPDIIMSGAGMNILYYSDQKVTPNLPSNRSVLLDPYYWLLPSGSRIDRSKLMVVLNNLQGIYIRASYALDVNGQARISNVKLDSAELVTDDVTAISEDMLVSSVELCECPPGYYGTSCQSCDIGYFKESEGPYGPICAECRCNNHADTCHPLTGECIHLKPKDPDMSELTIEAEVLKFCHFNPDLCEPDTSVETCLHNTTGLHCEKCAEGFYGDATRGSENDCIPCPCPLQRNNFALSCDALLDPNTTVSDNYCVCKPNYVGNRCQFCGPGYYGEPEVIGDYCKPCECNNNINVTDPDACDRFTGICQKCLFNTFGNSCERCEPWYYGDAIEMKNCQECICDQTGSELCDHLTGECQCFPGVEGQKCDRCQPDHWGFNIGPPGCEECRCSEASVSTQCDLETGQCRCKPGVTGQKCDRCMAGYWNLGPNGCESCGCNTEFAVGGTCDQETGQCQCLEGVIGQNCDHCPDRWVLVVNETRTIEPEWKKPFNYTEGCFPCSSCVGDLLDVTDELHRELKPIMDEFRNVERDYFAYKRLEYIENEVSQLEPEIGLLDPQEGARRLQPLQKEVNDLHKQANSLNVQFKKNIMTDLKKDAENLIADSRKAVTDMNKVASEVNQITEDMKVIADGLGSGVTPEQLQTSIAVGEEWLSEIKKNNFSDDRQEAIEEKQAAEELMDIVKDFAAPVSELREEVEQTGEDIAGAKFRIEDLRNHSLEAQDFIRRTNDLIFKNSKPAAVTQIERINAMVEAAENTIEYGTENINNANGNLTNATRNVDYIREKLPFLDENAEDLTDYIEQSQKDIDEASQLIYEAAIHVNDLEKQAEEYKEQLASYKSPGSQAIEAAMAYERIIEAVNEARASAEEGMSAAEEAQKMSVGVREKAIESKDRTQELYESAQNLQRTVRDELEPKLLEAQKQIKVAKERLKAEKAKVEKIAQGLEGLEEITDEVKETMAEANDANTIAHDALASIDARAQEISDNMADAKKLQDDYTEMKFYIEATKKALDEIEEKHRSQREKRQTSDEAETLERMDELGNKEGRISNLTFSVRDLMKQVKNKVKEAKEKLKSIEVGVAFHPTSYLEVRNPDNLEHLKVKTEVSIYVNVTKSESDERAFILYMGNEEDTHSKLPDVSTDDYMALEVVEGGRCKLTLDMGAGTTELYTNQPIVYGQWNYIEIERTGYKVTLSISSEAGPEEVSQDSVVAYLPRHDDLMRPYGSVFNLHPEYSRIFVGGFPSSTKIQKSVKESFMEGQIEGLKIGGKSVGLWNYKDANNIQGAPEKNKFKQKPETGVRFGGDGYLSLDPNKYMGMADEMSVKLRFKPETANGLLFLVGDVTSNNFVALELKNQYLIYSFNLGDGTVYVQSADPSIQGVWHNVEITRNGRFGSMRVGDSENKYEASSDGFEEQLDVSGAMYIGGFPDDQSTFRDVSAVNFSGCIEDVYIGPDRANINDYNKAVKVKKGCEKEVFTMVNFPLNQPGYVHINSEDLIKGSIEVSLMFKTIQKQGLIMYMLDTDTKFYYISLALQKGALELRVFPEYEMSTASESGSSKSSFYDDNKWHVVTILITEAEIQLHVDDHDFLSLKITNPSQLPQLDVPYDIYLGSVYEDLPEYEGSMAVRTPFVGCIRDVLILDSDVIDFNSPKVDSSQDPELGLCKVESIEVTKDEQTGDDSGANGDSGDDTDDDDDEDDEKPKEVPDGLSPFTLEPQESVEPPERFGQCALPIGQSPDPDLSADSGMRFGIQRATYLEYRRKLRIKKRSQFSIDLKTREQDGIIFYAADETNDDFVLLLMKGGKIVYGFSCGSGGVYITTENKFNDGAWHQVEFSRQGERGKLQVDGTLIDEKPSFGSTKIIEVRNEFFLGGLPQDYLDNDGVLRNLLKVEDGFAGCLRRFRLKGRSLGKWSKNPRGGVIPCSDKVEPGFFLGPGGGFLQAYRKFRVGLDFDITMQIKPRNVSGLLLAIQGRRDYLLLQMVDGTITFTVDNGRGPITAVFKPNDQFKFCDGNWHEIHAVKAKNVVTLSVDEVFAQPGIGVPGVSSTDTNHGLFIGGHPRSDRLIGKLTSENFVGCVRNIIIEDEKLVVTQDKLRGDTMFGVCPTI